MNELTKMFEGRQLRVIHEGDEAKFLLKDVCEILGLGHVPTVKKRLEEDVVSNHPLSTNGGMQIATFINEDGLYDVVLDSRKPEAKRFRKWVTSSVLPSIRKDGMYVKPKTPAELALLQAQNIVALEQKVNKQGEQLDNITGILALTNNDWRNKVNAILNGIAMKLGGGQYYSEIRNESYQLLEDRAGCSLTIRLNNRKAKMALRGSSKTAINKTTALEIIAEDKKLIAVYITVVKELAVKYQLNIAKHHLEEELEALSI